MSGELMTEIYGREGRLLAIDDAHSTTAPLYYEGICIGGPLHGAELRSTEKVHRISVPVGRGHNPKKSPDYFTGRYKLKEYHFRNGQWEYQE